jgi:hypothetical protein
VDAFPEFSSLGRVCAWVLAQKVWGLAAGKGGQIAVIALSRSLVSMARRARRAEARVV